MPKTLWLDSEGYYVGHPDTWDTADLLNTYTSEVAMRDEMSRFWDRHGMTEQYKTPEWIRLCERVNIMYLAILVAMNRRQNQ
jgi:hypothetical protein